MGIRSLNGLEGSSTTNVYVNTIDVFTGTSPIVVAQTSANQPVNISLKDINGFGGAGKILQINTTNDGLIWSDDPYENITVSLPLERTADNIALKGLSTMGAAGKIIKVNSLGTELEYADEDGSNWTVSGSNIYPITATQLLVNTTTNTNNRNLLINGDGEITTNLYLSGTASQIQIDSYSNTGLYFKNATNQGFKLFADHGNSGSPHLNNEVNSLYLFKISLANTIKHRFTNGETETYSNNASTDTTRNYFVKASNNLIGNYIQNDFTNNTFQLRTFTQTTDEYFLQYDITNQELRIPDKLILGAGSSQLSNGSYDYTLPGSSGTLALISNIPTYTAQSPILINGLNFSLTTVPINKGGTNITTYAAGDILYASATNVLSKLGIGGQNQVLKVNSSLMPQWKDETVMTASSPLAIIANDISLGTVPTQKGGTGFTSYAGGQLIYGSVGIGPPNALSLLNIGSTGQVLKVSSGGEPNWENEVSYTAQSPLTVVGTQFQLTTVPYNLGGTGQSSWVQGEILYASANNVLSKLGIGNAGQILQVNTAGTLPEWASFSGASKWSIGNSGLTTEFLYPTTSTQRVAIGYSTNPSDRRLYVNGDTETDELLCNEIKTQSNKNVFTQYTNSGNTLINHNDTPICTFFTNEVFDFSLRRNGTNTPLGVRIRNDGKTGSTSTKRATDGIYNYLEYFSCNINSHFSPNGGRVIGFTSYLGTQANSYTSNNFPTLATQFGNLYVSTDNDSMVSGDRTGGYYSAYFNSSGVNNVSDARLKKDVETIPNPLEIIRQLRGVYFKWNDGRSEERQTGFIAQEVDAVFTEVVDYDKGPDVYAMRYDKITGLLTEGIKAVDKENIELKEKVSTLETELNTYKAIVDKLVKAPSFKAFKESLA